MQSQCIGGFQVSSLGDYAHSGKYLKWQEQDWHNVALNLEYQEFYDIKPTFSDRHESEQYEIPVVVIEPDVDHYESILATKSKDLLVKLLNVWKEHENILVRLHKSGTGFYTKWTVTKIKQYYDKASGKVTKTPPKKKLA